MNIKILGAFAAVALLAACSNTQTASTGSGATATASGPVPGSEEDLVRNVGDRVFYDFNASALRADARATLDKQAAWLAKYPQNNVQVAGNCDERGTEEYNLALGQRRANAAAGYLAGEGRRQDAHDHDQLRQGSPDRTGPRRAGLGAEPQRDHLGALNRDLGLIVGVVEPAAFGRRFRFGVDRGITSVPQRRRSGRSRYRTEFPTAAAARHIH